MQKILITGSNGLLGQKLVEKLKNNPDFELVKEIKLSPAIYGVDGFYMAEIGWK